MAAAPRYLHASNTFYLDFRAFVDLCGESSPAVQQLYKAIGSLEHADFSSLSLRKFGGATFGIQFHQDFWLIFDRDTVRYPDTLKNRGHANVRDLSTDIPHEDCSSGRIVPSTRL